MSPLNLTTHDSGNPAKRKAKRASARAEADTKETRSSRHMNSQRLWQHAQGLHSSVPDGDLELKIEEDRHPIPNPETIPIDTHM